jgi:hypothetical protein
MILKDFKKDPIHNTFLHFKNYADPNTDPVFYKIFGSGSWAYVLVTSNVVFTLLIFKQEVCVLSIVPSVSLLIIRYPK